MAALLGKILHRPLARSLPRKKNKFKKKKLFIVCNYMVSIRQNPLYLHCNNHAQVIITQNVNQKQLWNRTWPAALILNHQRKLIALINWKIKGHNTRPDFTCMPGDKTLYVIHVYCLCCCIPCQICYISKMLCVPCVHWGCTNTLGLILFHITITINLWILLLTAKFTEPSLSWNWKELRIMFNTSTLLLIPF